MATFIRCTRFERYSDEDLALVEQADVYTEAYLQACEYDSPNSIGFDALIERIEGDICAELQTERSRRFGPPSDLPL